MKNVIWTVFCGIILMNSFASECPKLQLLGLQNDFDMFMLECCAINNLCCWFIPHSSPAVLMTILQIFASKECLTSN